VEQQAETRLLASITYIEEIEDEFDLGFNVHEYLPLDFDPYKGKFEPIEWDLRFWTSEFKFKDLPVNQLMKQVILNPLLEYERDQATQALLARFPVDTVLEKIDRKASIARKELRSDPYRQHADPHYGRFIPQKTVPFSMKNYDKAINKLKTGFKQRSKFVQSELDSVEAFYVVEKKGDDYLVTISASGNSPFRLDITRISALFGNNAQIYRYHDSFLDNPLRLSEAMFYPGRKVVPGNFMNSWNEWSIMAAGNEMFQPSPLHYQLLVKKADFKMSDTLPALSAVNAVTENPVNILPATNLPSSNTTASIHPWTIAAASVPNDPVVEFSGMVNVHKNIHISADQRVIIHPGTTFKIAHNTSIVFEGSVNANGTVEQPILFTRAHPDYEWGSLIIHSRPNADDIPSVKLKGIIVEGGSLTTHKLVNYPGQINIHEAQGFLLSDCTIRENVIGDDSLHVAYSSGSIKNCHFENTAFDAIDIDISNVSLETITFKNAGNDALDLMNSEVIVTEMFVDGAQDKCLSVGEDSEVRLDKARLHRCNIGIAVKDNSRAHIENIEFLEFRQSGISLYQKNPRYSTGGTISGHNLTGIGWEDVIADRHSVNKLDKFSDRL
ncbi:MAG: right-handed parallel beta-helix repeat-containing protein, partial [bacterium]